jgi:O-antigen/teichoic acid export membrane protein
MSSDLKQKTASAIAWNFVDKFGQQALTFTIGIILARNFLTPSDYGLMGMIAVFNVLALVLLESGFSSALIRKTSVSREEYSTVFLFNVVISIAVYLILFFCAPLIASFYRQPILISICRINCLALILNALAFVQIVVFTRATNFKAVTGANFIGLIVSGTAAIFMAYRGMGVYTLVYQNLIFIAVRNIRLWYVSPWKPSWIFDFNVIKGLWGYSSKLLVTGIVNAVFNYICPILIGRYYHPREVGFYSQANKFSDLSSGTVSSALQTATFPIMSQIKDDNERLKRSYRKIIRVTSFASFPVMFGLSAVAIPLIHVLLKEQWHTAAVYLQILGIGGAFIALISLNLNVLYVKGLSSLSLVFEIIRKSMILLSVFLTFRYGITPLIWGITIVNVIGFILSCFFSGSKIDYKIQEQLKDIFPYFLIAGVMAGGIYSLSFLISNEPVLLTVQIIAGITFYLGTVYLLGSAVFKEMIDLVKNKM